MTIQVSVIIWTVISFCVLAFVLDKFLFKPVFQVMDARAEKISLSAQQKETELNARESRRQEAELDHAAEVKAAIEQGEAAIETARTENKKRVTDRRTEHNTGIEQYGEELKDESEKIRESFSGESDEIAAEFVEAFSHNSFPFEPVSKATYDELVAAAQKAVEEKRAKAMKHTAQDSFVTEQTEPEEVVYRTEEEKRIAEYKAAQKEKLNALQVELLQESDEIKKKYSDDADDLALEYVTTIIR